MQSAKGSVLISGGGSGMGRYLAGHYLAQGADVAVFDLAIEASVREELAATGASSRVVFHEVDVCDAAALDVASRDAAEALGPPLLAINSAGVQYAAPFLELSQAQFSRVVDINLMGSRNFAAAVLPHLPRGGKLALVASLAGLVGNYSYTAYCASKFGVVGLAGALRVEALPLGVDVAVICPPEVDTPMVEEEIKRMHPVTRELKQVAGTLTLEQACEEIIEGLEGKQFMIIPGRRARLIERLSRWFPGIARARTDAIVRRVMMQ